MFFFTEIIMDEPSEEASSARTSHDSEGNQDKKNKQMWITEKFLQPKNNLPSDIKNTPKLNMFKKH